LLGMFYQRTNSLGAFAMLFASVAISAGFYFGFQNFPFVNLIWLVFLASIIVGVSVSHLSQRPNATQPVILSNISFKTFLAFNVWSVLVALILFWLYAIFW